MFAGLMMAGGMSAGLARGILGLVQVKLSAAGTTQLTAYQMLRATIQVFDTVNPGGGAILPSRMEPGEGLIAYNFSSQPMILYPPVGGTLNSQPINNGLTIPPGDVMAVSCVNQFTFFAFSGGPDSSGGLGALPPPGSVQYNEAGFMAGDAGMTYDTWNGLKLGYDGSEAGGTLSLLNGGNGFALKFRSKLQTKDVTYFWPATAGESGASLVTDGASQLEWVLKGYPVGPAKSVQWSAGTGDQFGGELQFSWDTAIKVLTIDQLLLGRVTNGGITSWGVRTASPDGLWFDNIGAIGVRNKHYAMEPTSRIYWSSSSGIWNTADVGMSRASAGVVEVNDGIVPGTQLRDIKVRRALVAPTTLGTVVDGALEYDGTFLWFTVGSTRKKVTLV